MDAYDPNVEWLGHVQPVGLVVAPVVLARQGLVPEQQIRADSDEVAPLLSAQENGPALPDPWSFFAQILGWHAAQVAGAPGGPAVSDELFSVLLPESETYLAPHWAIAAPGGGWQLLVRLEASGIEPDARGALVGWEATPHQRLERLLRETGVPTGLLLTDRELRLVHAPRGETSGWLAFPLRALAGVAGRPMLGGLKLLLSAFRLHNDATDRRLPTLLKASRDAQAEVSSKLATQVLGALHELLRGLHAADPVRIERLTKQRPAHVYEGLLTVLLRLVFLLYAEDRDLIPSRADGPARALYAEGYGVRALHARLLGDAARHPDTMEERRGAWGRLLALFRLVHEGDGSGWIRGRGGKLFDPREFPFLQGQDTAAEKPAPATLSDGCVMRMLDGLLTLDGERLSYRTLDVEQIGSVYETVMGFTVLALPGPALAIRAGKNNRTPVFVDLTALAAKKGAERLRFLKEEADRGQVPARVVTALGAATDAATLVEALRPIVDERGSPGGQPAAPGTPLLQPTDERRRSGSHYTPRDLTHPIVLHALEPAFDRIGADATPADVLALKICDPAMGSGAFLVEACRQMAARLVTAWARHPGTRPPIPADEDEELLARRLVAQRCLYGVDRNPLAVDLARLSLWLATLARDHEFTFLDHALKSGDSLVGLTRTQIGALTWGDDRQGTLFSGFVGGRIAEAVRARAEIRDAPDDIARAMQEARHITLESRMADVRALGDAVFSAFFGADKPRTRQAALHALQDLGGRDPLTVWPEVRVRAAALRQGALPLHPFHWEVEFPEVFSGLAPGFDAIVGNPPFAGKNTLINSHREHYIDWLQTLHAGAHGNADLVAHFFRRAFSVLRPGGCFGLIATNTIGQGDTRESGLRAVIAAGGTIIRATRRIPWPGEAAVVVSIVHILRGAGRSPVLDGRQVRRISAYLVEGDLDTSPARLAANAGKAFEGSKVYGSGFLFDDAGAAKGNSSSIGEMETLIERNPRNAERIRPYLGGDEVNTDPAQAHIRFVIDFEHLPLRKGDMEATWRGATTPQRANWLRDGIVPRDYPHPVAADWPDLLQIVTGLVKPYRERQSDLGARKKWWLFQRSRPNLYTAIRNLRQVCVTSQISAHHCFVIVRCEFVFSNRLTIFADETTGFFGMLQSGTHHVWARAFGYTLEDRFGYSPEDCFQTFPLPSVDRAVLNDAAETYHSHRAALMIARNEGLTQTYNRFHAAAEHAPDIQRLRDLHHAMDVAVLRAYGWDDLANTAEPIFLDESNEADHRYQGRLFWPAPFRDEVLARLLALNAERAAEERRLGLAPSRGTKEDEGEVESAA